MIGAKDIIQWGIDNWPIVLSAISALIAFAGGTAWGKANKAALDALAAAIENIRDPETSKKVKAAVKVEAELSLGAGTCGQAALDQAVAAVDAKKTPKKKLVQFLRTALPKVLKTALPKIFGALL